MKEMKIALTPELVVLVCHLPYNGDHARLERFPDHRPKDAGLWLLHGHLHSKPERAVNRAKRTIDVGVDAWDYKPVPVEKIIEIIQGDINV